MYTLHRQTLAHPSNPRLMIEFEAREETRDYSLETDDFRERRRIADELKKGNHAVWFCACVYVWVKGTSVKSPEQFLGCVSRKSFEEFQYDPYFKDMVNEATDDLFAKLDEEIGKAQLTLKTLQALKGSNL